MAYTVIPERLGPLSEQPQTFIYHLMLGPWDEFGEFQPILCGGGICLPYREVVPNLDNVCLDCRAARVQPPSMTQHRQL